MAGLAEKDAGSGGQAAESVREPRRERRNVIEGEDKVVAGELEQVAFRGGQRSEWGSARIDQKAQYAGRKRFAAAGRAAQNEDGKRGVGTERVEQPGERAEPCGSVGWTKIESGAQKLEGVAGCGRLRNGEGGGWGGGFENGALAGGNLPTIRGDFDELAFGVGEIEENGFGDGAVSAAMNAARRGPTASFRTAGGLRFEVAEDGREGMGRRDGLEFGVALGVQPLAEGTGTDGMMAVSGRAGGGDTDERTAILRGESERAMKQGFEGGEPGWAVRHGRYRRTRHEIRDNFDLDIARARRGISARGAEVIESVAGMEGFRRVSGGPAVYS
jgi:hypothetical protein